MKRLLLLMALVTAWHSAYGADPDSSSDPKKSAVIAALEAADGLSALSEIDFYIMYQARNREYFNQEAQDGGSFLAGRRAVRPKVEEAIQAMGEVPEQYAELAHWTRELWYLADAESAIVTGTGPVDDALIARMRELKEKTKTVRKKLRPLVPPGYALNDVDPKVEF